MVVAVLLYFVAAGTTEPSGPALREVRGVITYATGDGFYIDLGREVGLVSGDVGAVLQSGREVARIEVRHLTANSSYVAVRSAVVGETPASGDTVVFRVREPGESEGEEGDSSGTLREQQGVPADYVPLLTPWKQAEADDMEAMFHGNLRFSTSWIHDEEVKRNYIYHRVSTSGAVERAFSGPWSIEWDLDLSYRDGGGYRGNEDYRDLVLRPFGFVVQRHFEEGAVVGFGRIEPLAMPSIGRVDGAYGEVVVAEGLRFGSVVGLRPERDDLGFDTKEVVVAGYGVWDVDLGAAGHLWTAGGLLASWYEGTGDQDAVLVDTRWTPAPGTYLSLSSQTDLYTGREKRSGVGLTRLNLTAGTQLNKVLSVRGGWHQFQLADTDSQRSIVPADISYDRGHRRLFAGLRESLPRGVSLEQEVTQLAGADTDTDYQFTVRARKVGLPGVAGSSADVGAYNLVGNDLDGFGLNAGYSVARGRLYSRLGYDFSLVEPDGGSDFESSTISLLTDWQLRDDLSTYLRVAHSFGDWLNSTTVDLSLSWNF